VARRARQNSVSVLGWQLPPLDTVEHDHSIKSQLASNDYFQGITWCKFGHAQRRIRRGRNPRTPHKVLRGGISSSFLETFPRFCGEISPKVDKPNGNWLLKYPHEGPGVATEWGFPLRVRVSHVRAFVSHRMYSSTRLESQLPHKIVNLLFSTTNCNIKLTV